MIKISVVIPVYNMQEYLPGCLDSIEEQTICQDIELICVDDGSSDGSACILKEYSERFSNIQVISQDNSGAGNARNIGIKAASGEFVAFMDPDDYYPKKDTLEKMYNAAKTHQVRICGGSVAEDRGDYIRIDYPGVEGKNVFHQEGLVKYSDYQWDYFYHRFIYDRNMLIDNHIFFPAYRWFEDPPFFISAMITADMFYSIDDFTYCYRYGHKKRVWTAEKIRDLLKGLRDDLVISADSGLKELHVLTVHRMNRDFRGDILKHISDLEVLKELRAIDGVIRTEWIEDSVEKAGAFWLLVKTASDLFDARKKMKKQESELNKQQNELKKQENEINKLQKEVSSLKKSISFRVGRTLTFPGRKLRDQFRNIKGSHEA